MKIHGPILLSLTLACGTALADGVPGQGTWQSVLQARDLNGDGSADAYYDSSRNLTWAADADPLGHAATFAEVRDWVSTFNLFGVGGWRLPGLAAVNGGVPSCELGYSYDGSTDCGYNVDPSKSELAHMFQVVLGNLPYYDRNAQGPQPGWGLTNTGPFRNLVAGDYPTAVGRIYEGDAYQWLFQTYWGYQDSGVAGDATFHAWAVHDGDIAAVPEPGTWAMLLGGAALLLARRRLS